MTIMKIDKVDPQIAKLIAQEKERQKKGLILIPSENFVSPAVLQALGSVCTNKYAEGYPGKRYYSGNEYIDKIDVSCISCNRTNTTCNWFVFKIINR